MDAYRQRLEAKTFTLLIRRYSHMSDEEEARQRLLAKKYGRLVYWNIRDWNRRHGKPRWVRARAGARAGVGARC
jgi:hypothetical protein